MSNLPRSAALVTPNLAELGVPRRAPIGIPDMETIWLTPYPVITNYIAFCHYLHISPFGGGTRSNQSSWSNGSITSGYRSENLGNKNSAHRFGFALDIIFLVDLLKAARGATLYFKRVGIYPQKKFIHVDLADDNWIKKYNKERFWVFADETYHYFETIEEALAKAEEYL